MIAWLIIMGNYALGWFIASTRILRHRMTTKVCERCGKTQHFDYHYQDVVRAGCPQNNHRRTELIPRGLFRERNGRDVAIAASWALVWPAICVAVTGALLVSAAGNLVSWSISRAAGLTDAELKRQEVELDRQVKVTERELADLTAKYENLVTDASAQETIEPVHEFIKTEEGRAKELRRIYDQTYRRIHDEIDHINNRIGTEHETD